MLAALGGGRLAVPPEQRAPGPASSADSGGFANRYRRAGASARAVVSRPEGEWTVGVLVQDLVPPPDDAAIKSAGAAMAEQPDADPAYSAAIGSDAQAWGYPSAQGLLAVARLRDGTVAKIDINTGSSAASRDALWAGALAVARSLNE